MTNKKCIKKKFLNGQERDNKAYLTPCPSPCKGEGSKSHKRRKQVEHDLIRTEFLKNAGINVVRFMNEEIQNDIYNVIEKIKDTIKK